MHGINVNPQSPPAAPTPDQVKALGFDSVRFILRNSNASRNYYANCRANGLGVLGIVNNETLETYGLQDVVPLTADRIRADGDAISRAIGRALDDHRDLLGVECGNEPDGEPPSSWVMEQDAFVLYNNLAGMEAFNRGLTICIAGLSSGRVDWLAETIGQLSYDVLLIHPYAQTPASGRQLLLRYRALLDNGKQLGASEYFPFDGEEAAFIDMLDQEASWGSFFFGWSDRQKDGLGLHDKDGQLKPVATVVSQHLLGLG